MPIISIDPFEPNNQVQTARRNWKLPNGVQVIGISGHAGSGKDSIYTMLGDEYAEVYGESFADPLKYACAHAFGIEQADFYSSDTKEIINPFWGVSPRMIAQFVGSELFRDAIWKLLPNDQNDFWVRRMWGKLGGGQRHDNDGFYTPGDTVVIPDVRFQNEVDFIHDNDGIHIHLLRDSADGNVGLENHQSEAQNFSLKGERTYVVTNNGTLEELFEQVRVIVKNSGIDLTPLSVTKNL